MEHPQAMDSEFIHKLTVLVLANIGDEHFGAEALTLAAKMSRSHIQRRLKEIKNQSVSQFIREIRMTEAMKQLEHEEFSVAEIAYNVGFSSPAYFNYCFHRFYGFPPGEMRKRRHSGNLQHGFTPDNPDDNKQNSIAVQKIRQWFNWRLPLRFYIIMLVCILLIISFISIDNRFYDKISTWMKPEKSVIVLPFKNLSDQAEYQHFADGMMEDVLNNLFKISDIRVVSRKTSEHFSGTGLTLPEIARRVKVRYVLEGSVREQGDKVRICVQLIDARFDRQVWSANFDRNLADIMGVQSEIAIKVSEKLKSVLAAAEVLELSEVPAVHYDTYNLYLKGRFLLNKATGQQRADINRESLVTSIACFEQAIGADSTFALAYSGLAEAWFHLSAWGWYQPYSDGISYAWKYSERALELDADCAEAYAVKALCLVWPGRKFEEGRSEFLKALRLNPNLPVALQGFAQLLMITGPIEEARAHINRSLEIEPYYWVIQNLNAWIYYFEQKYDQAIHACQAARDLNPDFIENRWLFFLNYAQMGDAENAMEALCEILRLYPETMDQADKVMSYYNRSGITGLFTLLIEINLNTPLGAPGLSGHPFYLGWWYALAGNKEESLKWLLKNLTMPGRLDHYFNLLATNPDYDPYRNDPEFQYIIDELGLTPYHR
jgi:TolB-like protein/AraC-like DNA-binding protein